MPAWVSSPTHHAIVKALVAARKAAAMTQRDVAEKLGKPPSFIGKVESIERNLSVLEFVGWSRAIGTDATTILRSVSSDTGEKIEI